MEKDNQIKLKISGEKILIDLPMVLSDFVNRE